MKKKTLRFMTCAAVMALTLSVTACGDGSGSANSEIVQAEQDEEGLQGMRTLAGNMAFLMKSIALGKEKYGIPEKEPFHRTNFIR